MENKLSMATDVFSLYDLLIKDEVKGLIFDRFGQKHHFRLFPYKQSIFGAFEAYIYSSIDVRHQTKKFKNLYLTEEDKRVVLFAFMHRETLGTPDGMGDFSGPTQFVGALSPGSSEDNYIFDRSILLKLYDDTKGLLKQKEGEKRSKKWKGYPLPNSLMKILALQMSRCYFDKVTILKGSICVNCAHELQEAGYYVPKEFISEITSTNSN